MDKEQKEFLLNCWQNNMSYRQISEALNTVYNTNYWDSERVRNIVRKYKKCNDIDKLYSGDNRACVITNNKINKTRILHISDQHCPYNLPIDIYRDYIGKVDILIFGGDEEDCQSISKFKKKYRIPFTDEMIQTRQMIIDTINYIKPKKVKFIIGNHNCRLISFFSEKVHEDLLTLMPESNLDFIVDIGFWKHDHQNKSKTYYEPIINIFKNIEIEHTKNWWCKVGQTIFAHPKAFKLGILATTEKAYLYFLQLGETFDTLCLSHTHKQAFCRYGKTYMYESGSLCEEQGYAIDGSLIRPQNNGFVYLVQDENGKLIYNESKLVCLD